jgi:hypothetical protein
MPKIEEGWPVGFKVSGERLGRSGMIVTIEQAGVADGGHLLWVAAEEKYEMSHFFLGDEDIARFTREAQWQPRKSKKTSSAA